MPHDYPLEPGSGTPRARTPGSPADRIAASEAALGSAKPSQGDPGNSNFIMAARRAAQAAGEAPAPGAARARRGRPGGGSRSGLGKVAKGLRSVAVAISVVVIVLGALRVATNFLPLDHLQHRGAGAEGPTRARQRAQVATPPAPAPATPGPALRPRHAG